MAKRGVSRIPENKPIVIGCYTLGPTGLTVNGHPSAEEHEGVGEFIQRAHRASGFWLADWLRYGESRKDWQAKIEQVAHLTGISEKRAKNIRSVGAIEQSRRREGVEFGLHEEVAGLTPDEQSEWLERAEEEGWDRRELRLNIRAAKRSKIIEGQAVLQGMYRVIYADFPWLYDAGKRSGGAQAAFPGMTIEAGCQLPVKAHAMPNSVLFFWVTAPMLYENPGPREIIDAWGFTPKTGIVWDKVEHNVGSYVSVRHEHLIIATRGSAATPDRPTPMFDSVVTERRQGAHSAKPATFRKMIERMYDGPYLELFGREKVDGWDVFGNDARLWAEQAAS